MSFNSKKLQTSGFNKLNEMLPFLKDSIKNQDSHYGLYSETSPDISITILLKDNEVLTLALAHFNSFNGKLIADPQITMEVNYNLKTAYPIDYKDKAKRLTVLSPEDENLLEILRFLNHWLSNLSNHTYKLESTI